MPPLTLLQSFLKAKCPHCRQGETYTNSPVHLTKFDKMHKHCPHCGFRYEIEPGFFFGAMYVSYAISIAIMISCGIFISTVFTNPSLPFYVGSVIFFSILVMPFSFRFSRLFWLYIFVEYEPNTETDKE